MSFDIDPDHPLYPYHRRWPVLSGRTAADLTRQWGRAAVHSSVPESGFPAGSFQTITIRYTVGSMGLDEDGGLKLSFRFVTDAGTLQAGDPSADNFVSASTSGPVDLEVQVERKGTVRPFQRTVFVHVRNATLEEGIVLDIVLGDTSCGSRGWRQQTYCEHPFPVRFSIDPLGTHDYQELPFDLGWDIVPGPADRFVVNVPSVVAAGEEFELRVKAEDSWGNALRDLSDTEPRLVLRRAGGEAPVAAKGSHDAGVWRFVTRVMEPGPCFFEVDGELPSTSNGVDVRTRSGLPAHQFNWVDLHGQTGETVGAGTIEEYFHYGRHYSFLDGSVHQGNDFQIGAELWNHITQASHAAYRPGEFVTFPGYEWSGTEGMGGDHNVIYFEDDPPIYRSTGWLDGNPFEETAPLPKLYEALSKHQAMTIAHVGGRPASFRISDPELEHLWELHSAWGTFEWVYHEAFSRGIKVGFVCNSDGHKCRPGASYPGAGIFGTLGGLTCILSKRKDREGFWDALRSRRTYGTTGQRILVDCDLSGHPIGSDVELDSGTLRVRILGTAPILRIDLLRREKLIDSYLPAQEEQPDTLLVRFGGARVKGRARMVEWTGRVSAPSGGFERVSMNGIFSPSYGIRNLEASSFDFACVTTGNLVNLELGFRKGFRGVLEYASNRTSFSFDLADAGRDTTKMFEAPLNQSVEVCAVKRSALPLEVEHSFELNIDHDHEEPYFLRVTQVDEGKAWTSPYYVRKPQLQPR